MTVERTSPQPGVAMLRLTGATASASFSRASIPVIAKAIDEVLNDAEVRALVITGEGRFFSAGADIDAFAASIEAGEAPALIRDLTGHLHPLLLRMRTSSTICVAAINGAAAGGGLGLALACDARVASTDARLAASYAGMGLSPDGGSTWLLPRLVGTQVARRFFFDNTIWSAKEAHEHGAVDYLVPPESLIDTAVGVAVAWSGWSEHVREATKHLLHVETDNDLATHLDHERTLIEAAGTTQAFEEGVAAFLARRRPKSD